MPTRPKPFPEDIAAICNGWVKDVLFILGISPADRYTVTDSLYLFRTLNLSALWKARWSPSAPIYAFTA